MSYSYDKAWVVKVVDGDTVRLRVDVGFRITWEDNFRLYGINAPEMRGSDRPEGILASQYLETIIPVGSMVEITTYKAGKYGRWLCTIYRGGESVNEKMIEAGHAIPYLRSL